jgi:hypothetical protein
MADTNHRVDVIIKILANRIDTRALVYDGWPNKRHVKDLRIARGLSEDFDVRSPLTSGVQMVGLKEAKPYRDLEVDLEPLIKQYLYSA